MADVAGCWRVCSNDTPWYFEYTAYGIPTTLVARSPAWDLFALKWNSVSIQHPPTFARPRAGTWRPLPRTPPQKHQPTTTLPCETCYVETKGWWLTGRKVANRGEQRGEPRRRKKLRRNKADRLNFKRFA